MACVEMHEAMLVILLHEEAHAHIFDKLPCVQFMEGKSCIPGSMACVKMHEVMLVIMLHEEVHTNTFDNNASAMKRNIVMTRDGMEL